MSVTKEYRAIQNLMLADPEYAWAWHCNVAMASVDEGMDHAAANRAAARFMQTAFGVNTANNPHFADTQP